MKVRPANPAAIIRDPHTKRPLPADGGQVPDSNFWRRRIASGEVVRVVEPAKPKPAPQAATEAAPARPAEIRQPLGSEPVAPLTTRGPEKG